MQNLELRFFKALSKYFDFINMIVRHCLWLTDKRVKKWSTLIIVQINKKNWTLWPLCTLYCSQIFLRNGYTDLPYEILHCWYILLIYYNCMKVHLCAYKCMEMCGITMMITFSVIRFLRRLHGTQKSWDIERTMYGFCQGRPHL